MAAWTLLAAIAIGAAILIGAWPREVPLQAKPTDAAPPVAPPAHTSAAPSRSSPAPTTSTAAPVASGPILEVRLQCNDPNVRRVRFHVDRADREIAGAVADGAGPEYTARMVVRPFSRLRVGATTFADADAPGAEVPPVWIRLAPDDHQTVRLSCDGSPTRFHIVGPSAELLPRLGLQLWSTADGARSCVSELALDAAGDARCYLPQQSLRATLGAIDVSRAPAHRNPSDVPSVCALRDAAGDFDFEPTGEELVLQPIDPIVGIVLGSPGHEQPATLWLDPSRRPVGEVTTLLSLRIAAEQATTLHGETDELGVFAIDLPDSIKRGDLWFVDPLGARRTASLIVHIDAAQGVDAPDLLAEPLPQGDGTKLDRRDTTQIASLVAGDYRLTWWLNGGRGPIAIDNVQLRAGATTEVTLRPPQLQRWTAQLQNADASQITSLFLNLHGIHSLGGAREGSFLFDLSDAPRPGDSAEVFSWVLRCSFPAVVKGVDATARRIQVESPVTDAQWCRVHAQAMSGGRLHLRLLPSSGSASLADLAEDTVVPLLRDQSRDGAVVEELDGRTQVIAWFQLRSETSDLAVRGSGRWTSLHIARPILRAQILAEGPQAGGSIPIYEVDRAGDYPLFVADGTRTFHIDLTPGGRLSFDASLPIEVR